MHVFCMWMQLALEKTNKKFTERFTKMEAMAAQQHKSLTDMTLEEMDALWNAIKQSNLDTGN